MDVKSQYVADKLFYTAVIYDYLVSFKVSDILRKKVSKIL